MNVENILILFYCSKSNVAVNDNWVVLSKIKCLILQWMIMKFFVAKNQMLQWNENSEFFFVKIVILWNFKNQMTYLFSSKMGF